MKLSDQTISVLKNFSNINSGIYFQEGKVLKTVAPSKAILAEATIEEDIPIDFGIYDLTRLLGILTLFENPEVTFHDKFLTLHNSSGPKCKFSYCDPSLVVRPPEGKNVQLPTEDVQFRLSKNDFESSMKASAILQYPEIAIEGDKNVISIMVVDSKNKMSDVYSLPVGETDKEFKFIFKVENFSKLMAKDYMVKLSQKGLSNFESSDKSISYFVALEPNSEFKND